MNNAARGIYKPLIATLAVAAILVVVTWWTTSDFRARRDGRAPDRTASVAVGDRDPKPARAPAMIPGSALPGQVATPSEASARIERRKSMQAQLGREASAARNALAETFKGESVDAAWAMPKQAQLDAIAASPAIASGNVQPSNLSIRCRRTVCRLEAGFASDGQADDWAIMFTASVGGAMPASTVTRARNPDGSASIEIYGKAR